MAAMVDEYVPAKHGVHVVPLFAPRVPDHVPALQFWQLCVDATVACHEPAWHCTHALEPPLL